MEQFCPKCGYDLSGLPVTQATTCPECGTPADLVNLATGWDRRLSNRWSLFLWSPIISLPGLLLFLVGHPIVSWVLGTVLAYRAFDLEQRLRGGPRSGPFILLFQSTLLALSWTAGACVILWIAAAAIVTSLVR